jgi:hypothetical protein
MIVITFDTLALPANDLGARQPRNEARRLWNALFPYYHGRIIIIADGIAKEGHQGEQILLEWLKKEGFKASSVDMVEGKGAEVRYDRVVSLNSVYGKIHWYIDIDPEAIAKVAHCGVPTLLVTIPDIVRPEWAEGRQIKGWDTLVEEIESQELAKKERVWGDVS